MLSAAAQREDCCLVASPKLKGGAALKVANKLISARLVEEIEAEAPAPMWRRDTETGQACALKLTTAGAKAIGIDEDVESQSTHNETGALENRDQAAETTDASQLREPACAGPSAPRGGSKLAHVIALLQRGDGATIDELIAATGWLARATRAALTGLRKRSYAVTINRADKERESFYRIRAEAEGDGGPVGRPVEQSADSPASTNPAQRLSKARARRAA
jgi:Protein of unknown function (DUF3489)